MPSAISAPSTTDESTAKRAMASDMPVGSSSQANRPPASERGVTKLHRPVLVDRIVYATITMMSVLIIYDGSYNQNLWMHHLTGGATYLPL